MLPSDDWLSEEDARLAQEMQAFVTETWDKRPDPAEYTPHDPHHFKRVESWIKRLIPQGMSSRFSRLERKLLTWCAWTHDIGMFRSVAGTNASATHIRRNHIEKSADWVANEGPSLRLSKLEAQIVADINRFHSRQYALRDCPEERLCHGQLVRPRLLAAYLRLADALDVAHDRVDQQHRFELLLHQISRETDTTLFHWTKSLVVADIAVDHGRQELRVDFFDLRDCSTHNNTDQDTTQVDGSHRTSRGSSETFEFIKRYVLNEIEDELASVEKVLALGGISSFHVISSSDKGRIRGQLADQLQESMNHVMTYIQMAQSPSSTAVTHAALDAMQELLSQTEVTKDKQDSDEAWSFFCKGLQRLEHSLSGQIQQRRCHVELRRIHKEIQTISGQVQEGSGFDALTIDSVNKFVHQYNELVRMPSEAQVEQFASLLGHPKIEKQAWTFLLYGCSETVARVLAMFEAKHSPIRIAIAEGRPKSQHGARNKLSYIDAENYLVTLRNAGVRSEDIYVIPDACAASSIDRGRRNNSSSLAPIDAVLLGANGIYLEPSVTVAHSAGHLGVAIAAAHYRVPVVVFASAAKIYVEAPEDWGRSQRSGDRWLTSDADTLDRLRAKPLRLKGTWNPREDHLPADLITAIVTESGIVKLADQSSRSKLRNWAKAVDKCLSFDRRDRVGGYNHGSTTSPKPTGDDIKAARIKGRAATT